MPGEEAFLNGIKVKAKADGSPLSFLFVRFPSGFRSFTGFGSLIVYCTTFP